MMKQIDINPNRVFEQVEIEQTDDVFWQNNDAQPHWPMFWAPRQSFQVLQQFPDFPNPQPQLPQRVQYQCAIPGHQNETGIILVFDDFTLATLSLSATAGQINSIPLTSAGKSPYDTSASTGVSSWVTFAEPTPDSSVGFNAVLTNPPTGNLMVRWRPAGSGFATNL
jgi:hypothetical protein